MNKYKNSRKKEDKREQKRGDKQIIFDYNERYFLQLIDCGEEHYPCVSICLTDRESSSPLPYERASVPPEIRVSIHIKKKGKKQKKEKE